MHICSCLSVGLVHTNVPSPHPKSAFHPLELELLAVVNCPNWGLESELESAIRARSALNHGVISPAPNFIFTGKICF